ncbi:solute carrier family 15 member 2 [Nephila pilipes]|uniref:Oligopeptide transporter 1 n=1 Tax=Nephila pilipes TaxID=299642 RepID=A0A8X6NJ33_NEPPI|nr:solute carrier family 15 member 2 [Nephila pilipes]
MSEKKVQKINEKIEEKTTDDETITIDDEVKKQSLQETSKEQDQRKVPKGIYFVIGTEFCERFNYYSLITIQTIYLSRELDFSENISIKIYHGIVVVSYFMTIFGAILADNWLGKFWTILYISILYGFGNIILTAGSLPNKLSVMRVVSLVGIFVISIGIGGVKPCISSFGGDQFTDDQEQIRHVFFSIFYFAINGGSLIAKSLIPILREQFKCFNQDSCFPLAYLVTTSIYIIGLFLFIIGKPFYVIKAPDESILTSFIKCIGHALYRKTAAKNEKKKHWLDYADDRYDSSLIADIKDVARILFIYIPLPLFWALWEQQGSRWVLQGSKMDGEIHGYYLKPDQMLILNPLLIIIIIPILNSVIYPTLSKLKICRTPLQRMTTGGLLVAFSFINAAFIQLKIESKLPEKPPSGKSEILLINNSPCTLEMKSPETLQLSEYGTTFLNVPLFEISNWLFVPSNCNVTGSVEKKFNSSDTFHSMMVTLDSNDLVILETNDSRIKLKNGDPLLRLFYSIDYELTEKENALFLLKGERNIFIYPDKMIRSRKVGMTEYYFTKPGVYELILPVNGTNYEDLPIAKVKLNQGGRYIVFILQKTSWYISMVNKVETVKSNSLHILWQIPQYIFLTIGEAMFSITGLDFSYSQAPESLKSVVQAIWLGTIAIGNLIVVLLTNFIIDKQSNEFFMYAALLTLSMGAFGIMSHYYAYVETEEKS